MMVVLPLQELGRSGPGVETGRIPGEQQGEDERDHRQDLDRVAVCRQSRPPCPGVLGDDVQDDATETAANPIRKT